MSGSSAQREARRKRILENAEDRLSRILSREKKEDDGFPVIRSERITRVQHEDSDKSQEDEYQRDKPVESEVSTSETVEDVRTIFVNRPSLEIESVSEAEFVNVEDKITRARVVIIILALMVRYLLFLCEQYAIYFFQTDILKLHLNKIFFPFFAYEVIEFFYFPMPVQRSSVLMTLLSFKVDPRFAQKLLIAIGVVNKFSKDLMLYFFTFCVFEYIIDFVKVER